MVNFLNKRRFFIVKTMTGESDERKVLFKAKSRSDVKHFVTVQGKVELIELKEITKAQYNGYKKGAGYMTVCI